MTSMSEKATRRPVVLAIGGVDPTGRAGLAADIRAAEAAGAHAAPVAAALTVQNAHGVQWIEPPTSLLLQQQIRAVLEDLPVAAVKIGLMPTAATIEAVEEALLPVLGKVPVVIDPVLGASAGGRLVPALSRSWRKAMRDLSRKATLLTPNLMEAGALMSELPVTGRRLMRDQAKAIAKRYGCAVLVKGGHLKDGDTVFDLLVTKRGEEQPLISPRAQGDPRGTGCTLATLIAAYLAHGCELFAATQQARRHLMEGMEQPQDIGGAGAAPVRLPGRAPAPIRENEERKEEEKKQ